MSDLKVGSLSAVSAPTIGATVAGASHAKAAAAAGRAGSPQTPVTNSAATPVVAAGSLDAGEAPVDVDRVASIRSAIASGSYPLIPARIGDAMIAAGVLLQSGR